MNKPIVFVFGTKEGDVDGRKKNLSAINTQVAYRAHERRREKKSKARANAKKETVKPAEQVPQTKARASAITPTQANPPPISQQLNVFSAVPGPSSGLIEPIKLNHSSPQSLSLVEIDDRSDSNSSDLENKAVEIWSSPSASSSITTVTDLSVIQSNLIADSKLHNSLDPFFRLPAATNANARDRWLLQHYFAELRPNQFGTNHNAIFCPGRDWVSHYVSSEPLCLEWILILAEEFLSQMGMLPDKTSVIQRKSKAYSHLNNILNACNINCDTSISGIMFTAIMDYTKTPLHLRAMDRLIRENGGMQGFLKRPFSVIQPEHIMTVYAFGPCEILELTELEAIKSRFFDSLRILRDRARNVRSIWRQVRTRRSSDAFKRQMVDSNAVLIDGSQDDNFCSFIKSQHDCFDSECIRLLVFAPYNETLEYAEKARQLAVLHQISMILYTFGDDYLSQAMFLNRLSYVAEMSSARDHQGHPKLALGTLLLLISFVRQEIQNYADEGRTLAKGIEISSAVIDGLKLFGLLKETGRILLVTWLRDWLVLKDRFEPGYAAQQRDELTDEGLAGLSSEIIGSWYLGMLQTT